MVDKNNKIEEEEKTEVSKVMVVPLVKGKETEKECGVKTSTCSSIGRTGYSYLHPFELVFIRIRITRVLVCGNEYYCK